MPTPRKLLNHILGELPFTPELYWLLRKGQPLTTRYNLGTLRQDLEKAVEETIPFINKSKPGKKVLIFSCLHFWVEYNSFLGVALAGQGHQVSLAYLPYADWRLEADKFEKRRHDVYTQKALLPAHKLLKTISLFQVAPHSALPAELQNTISQISLHDVQYTHEREDVDLNSDLYRLRLERNSYAARAIIAVLEKEQPDVVLVPNGVIMEFGAVYHAACYLGLPVVTYEFSEDREQIWISHTSPVIYQNTDDLWKVSGNTPLTISQLKHIKALEAARMGAQIFGKSDRLWQDIPTSGAGRIRLELELDERPIILMATNVIGDSLTLGRGVFGSMSEWILRSITYASEHQNLQLVVRVHPGERYSKGPSMVNLIAEAFPQLPPNVHIVGPMDKINTYDIISTARVGTVYTTTTGMEMAMNKIPVVVVGQTHFRGRGFTWDPATWEEYFAQLEALVAGNVALTNEQVERAWNYAYRFFFQYPRPFPWKLVKFFKDLETWPLERVLSEAGMSRFGNTFRALVGEPIDWADYQKEVE